MTEENKIKEEYRQYQLGTQGIDIWEEDAFRAEWLASKKFFKPDVIKSVCDRCEGKPESADNVLCSDCYSDLHGM